MPRRLTISAMTDQILYQLYELRKEATRLNVEFYELSGGVDESDHTWYIDEIAWTIEDILSKGPKNDCFV